MGRILWLASYPKSGNTWMRAFLHNLIVDKGGPLDLNAMSKGALMDAAHQHYSLLSNGDPRQLGREEIARLRPRMQASLAASRTGTVFVKTHTALTMLAGHPSHDPALTLGSIYMVRDPRDIALSHSRSERRSTTLASTGLHVRKRNWASKSARTCRRSSSVVAVPGPGGLCSPLNRPRGWQLITERSCDGSAIWMKRHHERAQRCLREP